MAVCRPFRTTPHHILIYILYNFDNKRLNNEKLLLFKQYSFYDIIFDCIFIISTKYCFYVLKTFPPKISYMLNIKNVQNVKLYIRLQMGLVCALFASLIIIICVR